MNFEEVSESFEFGVHITFYGMERYRIRTSIIPRILTNKRQALFLDVFQQLSPTQSWRKLEFFENFLDFLAKFLEFL